ncbi:MAG: glycosyltransferase family 1 protein [Ferruginibacter sp.]
MRIGFDAKRAYQNGTGLGHYSRTLIHSMANIFSENEYYLFAPILTNRFNSGLYPNVQTITPTHFPYKQLKAVWRSRGVKKELEKLQIDVYHGVSNEIPIGIQYTNIKSVVTIHDLIFERFPSQYNPIDVFIYRRKFKYACKHADAIIAISQQTKHDLINIYKIAEENITVCYQSCDPSFTRRVAENEKEEIRQLYGLPSRYFLTVGSIIERKNLLTLCKAMLILKEEKINIPLLVIGKGDGYEKKVKQFVEDNDLQNLILFLSDHPVAREHPCFKNSSHFPALYQMAEAMIYPSTFEGFGIPILEALYSRLPVITSNVSCMPEAAGDAAAYIHPFDERDLAAKMKLISADFDVAASMKEKGWQYAQLFNEERTATAVMNVYQKLML